MIHWYAVLPLLWCAFFLGRISAHRWWRKRIEQIRRGERP